MKKAASGKSAGAFAPTRALAAPAKAPGQTAEEGAFAEVVSLIRAARARAQQAANTEMVGLYGRLGEYLHHKIEADGWAKGTVMKMAACIALREPGEARLFAAEPVAQSAVLRDLPGRRKTLTTGATFAVNPQPHHS